MTNHIVYETPASDRAHRVAINILNQISMGTKMSIGYHSVGVIQANENPGKNDGVIFKTRILPFKKNGERAARPRIMWATIELNGLDLYDMEIYYISGGKKITHYEATNIYADQLNRLLIALDYDGKETLNPRHL